MSGHGGNRPGAGRKPRGIRYAREVAATEGRIVAALDQLVDTLLAAARNGDTSAARYLLDRILGRPAAQTRPASEDYTVAYDNAAAEEVAEIRRRRELAQKLTLTKSPDYTLAVEHQLAEAELCDVPEEEQYDAQERHMKRRNRERKPGPAIASTPWVTPPVAAAPTE